MRVSGKLIKGTKTIKEVLAEREDEGSDFRENLESCLLELCKALDIPVPLWLKKNTSEFAAFHRTSFNQEHFVESIKFDRFEIRLH